MATRTVSNSGGNFNSIGTWVEGVVPTSADDVVFTATSGNLTVNVSSVCKTFVCTNFTGTLTMSNILTVSGNITLVNTMTISGTSPIALAVSAIATITTNGKSFNSFSIGSGNTVTLAENVTVLNDFNVGNSTVNGFSITVGGSFTNNNAANAVGTTTYTLNGTGTLSSSNTGSLTNNLTINTSGTITLGTTFRYSTGILTYVSGTIVRTGNTLVLNAATTLNTSGMTWNNISTSTTTTITINSPLLANSIVLGNAPVTFSGTSGFTVNSFTATVISAARSITFKNGITYTINNNLTVGSNVYIFTFTSDSGTLRANIVLGFSAVQSVINVNATRIDSSGGQTIYTTLGRTLTNTINWSKKDGTSWWQFLK